MVNISLKTYNQDIPTKKISIGSKEGKAMRQRTINSAINRTGVLTEAYIGVLSDYEKGVKKRK